MIRLELPYPPSLNRYYRAVGGRVLISADGRKYRTAVAAAVLLSSQRRAPDGPLCVEMDLFPPDRRKRDADNGEVYSGG